MMKGENKMGKKKYRGFRPVFQNGVFPKPFAPRETAEDKNSAEEENVNNTQKENIKSTLKSAWKQKTDRKKSNADNRREQWKKYFDYRMELQDTFTDFLPDDISALPALLQKLPVSPKDFMKQLKEFQIMANEHFLEQVDSLMDFYFKGQERIYDLVALAMEKKEEDESEQADDGEDRAEESAEAEETAKAKTVKKPRTRTAQKTAAKSTAKTAAKTAAKTGKKTGTKTAAKTTAKAGKKTAAKGGKRAKAAEIAEDYTAEEAKAAEIVEDYAAEEAKAAETFEDNAVNESGENA